MAKNVAFTFTLAFLVALSGCSGLIPIGNSPDGSPTPAAQRSYDNAVENHTETLQEIGRFKIQVNRSETFPDRVVNAPPFTQEFVADTESNRYLVGEELDGHNGVYQSGPWYQAGNTSWERIEFDNGSTIYRRHPSDRPDTPRKLTLSEVRAMEAFSTQFPFERNGTAIFQGQRVARYTAGELGSSDGCIPGSGPDVKNVSSVTVVALVDDRGIIRKLECRITGETSTGERVKRRGVWTVTLVGVVEIRAPEGVPSETAAG